MKFNKPFILIAAMMAGALGLSAQNNTMSPYSRYGYGILNDHVSSSQRAMGGIGYAMNNGRQINSMNPASYAAIDTLTFLFDIGFDIQQLKAKEGDAKGNHFTGGLDYVTMQFPLGKYMGGSVGLLPYSQTGYSFGNEIVNGEDSHQGSGGINELYFGISGRPFKGFTVGANISYLFGTTLNDTYLMPTSSSTSLFERVLEVKDYSLTFGAQYSFKIKNSHELTLGAVFSPGKSWHGKTYGVYYDVSASQGNDPVPPDTVGYTRLSGKFTMPATYGIGLNYKFGTKLMAEIDYTYQPWGSAKYEPLEGFETTQFNDRWKVAAGLQYTPDVRGGYLKRINYRIGCYMNNDYIKALSNDVKDYGVSIGFGLPAPVNRLTKTVVNVAFEYRHRQSSPVKLVTENYFQLSIGINFNELWFWKNKIQ